MSLDKIEQRDRLRRVRSQIDDLDNAILSLLNVRYDAATSAAAVRREYGGPHRAPDREKEIVNRLAERSTGYSPARIEALWRILFEAIGHENPR